MMSLGAGFEKLRYAIPDVVLLWLHPSDTVSTVVVRVAVELTLFSLWLALVVRLGLAWGGWLWHRAHDRVEVRATRGAHWRLRRASGVLALALPWLGLAVLQLARAEPLPELCWFFACASALVWTMLWAADHGVLALDRRHGCIVWRQGSLLQIGRAHV